MTPFDVYDGALDGTQLIEASAGTGKTWTLCGLVVRLLLERGLPLQQVLVVTFTNAATAELRGRIRDRLAETLVALRGRAVQGGDPFVPTLLARLRGRGLRDEAMAAQLEQALQGFDEAAVFTIHGFCQRALADTPFAAGVPLALEPITDDRELRAQVVQDFWRRRVAVDGLTPALAAQLVQQGDRPDVWATVLGAHLARPLAEAVWPDGIDDAVPPAPDALAAAHAQAQRIWQAERDAVVELLLQALKRKLLNGNTYKPASVQAAAASWDMLLAGADPLAVSTPLDKLDLLQAGKLAQRTNKGHSAPEHPFFDAAETLAGLRDQALHALSMQRWQLLRDLVATAPAALRQAQRERHVVSFDNMLFNLYERLQGPAGEALATALRGRFGAALIDEFQDTDPLQFAVFNRLFGAAGLPMCLIGDPKQAIYSFRGADLHTYLRARQCAASEHTLADNQRSTGPLLDAFNALFGGHPQAFMLPGLPYHPVRLGAKRRPPLVDATAPRAAMPLWLLPDDPPLPKAATRAAAARACAGEIARLLGAAQQGRVTYAGRPLAGGDIAVLVRSRAHGSLMREALAELGVASVELASDSVFDSVDAEALTQVLASMLEPGHAGRLRSALATDAMGWDAARLHAAGDDDPAWLDLVGRFAAYRAQWRDRGVGPMLRQWMVDEAVQARLLARPDGERRLTNLRHLAELLQQAEHEHASPEALWRWLQAQRSAGREDEAAQLRLESDRHLVQVVTIHRSKGLEYPIVFCPFLWDGYAARARDKDAGQAWHREDGQAVIDHRPTLDDDAADQVRLEAAAEALRLIYVALTRAVHRCHLVVGPYTSGNGNKSTEAGRSLLNWLVAGAGQTPTDWLKSKAETPPQTQAGWWRDWASALPQQVSLDPLPDTPGLPLPPDRPPASTIAALPAPRVPPGWWVGSFSALMSGARHERAAVDHDLRVVPAALSPAAVLPADDILRFPRGPAAGECLHAVFEQADFADRDTWPGAIATALQRQPLPATEGDPAVWTPMLSTMLSEVLNTPLPGDLTLAQVRRERRLVEWEFVLPAAPLSAATLGDVLRAEGWDLPALAFGTLQGYLRGFVDLVFEHQGRWTIVDWKGNHLGEQPADYADAALAAEMLRHGYTLQALLYALALHRHLQQRLPGYDPARHFGGVQYLFVRGVRPGWQQADGRPCGVVHLQPSPRLLQRLSALFGERHAGTAALGAMS